MKPRPNEALEKVVLQNRSVELHLPGASMQQVPTERFVEGVRDSGIRGLNAEALPDNVKWRVDCGALTVFIVELKPEARSILWIDAKSPQPFGPGATYTRHRVATPFVVLKVPFLNGRLFHECELFYRSEPLRKVDDDLYWPNLLNVSPNSYDCTAWLCTQYLEVELTRRLRRSRKMPGMGEQLDAVVKHAWGGGFNKSSEAHEGKSCFQKAREDKIDRRVTSVTRWQAETERDASFILKVKWKSAGVSVETLIRRQMEKAGLVPELSDTEGLINVLISQVGEA